MSETMNRKKAIAKGLSYEEFIALANEHYENGGNAIVECWDRITFNEYISQFGSIALSEAHEIIHGYHQEQLEEFALISDKTDVKGNNKLSMNCILEMSDNIKNQIFFDGFEFMLSDGSIIRIDFATIKSNIHENVIEFECSAPLYDVFPEMKTHINQLSTAQITNVYYDTEDDIKPVRLIEVKIYDPNRNYYYTKNKEVPNVQ